jgi:hypothetical protein
MNSDKQKLMKHFSVILRTRSIADKEPQNSINPAILKSLSRKDLIHIISDKYEGSIPKQYDLMGMENQELLKIIGDDMYIISHVTQAWCKELKETKSKDSSKNTEKKPEATNPSKKK